MIVGPEFLDSSELPPVLIVGSGPAGVSLAVRLAARGIGSLVLEAGSEGYDADVQDAYAGSVVGDPYYDLDITRLRFFGGSSNHWQGWCRPLDAWDFERREDIDHTGWPIARTDLDPYLADARDILEVQPTGEQPLGPDLIEVGFQLSPPVRFGDKYTDFFKAARDTHLALMSPAIRLESRDGRVVAVHVQGADGRARRLTPDRVVLATGGIENARLLLWSNAASDQRVVADDRALGRYWMEHPHGYIGQVQINRNFDRFRLENDQVRVALSPEAMRRHGVMNGGLRFYRTFGGEDALKDAVKRGICLTEPLSTKALALADVDVSCTSGIQIAWEQAPDPENRVALSEGDRDALGVPRTVLHWRKAPIDYRTPKVALELLGRYLLTERRGRVRAEPFLIDEGGYPEFATLAGHHHMGGTRMSSDPATGVVDADLKVFGQSNLHVLGSSVFPTGGHANPTLTIVQLALRLGDHLAATAP